MQGPFELAAAYTRKNTLHVLLTRHESSSFWPPLRTRESTSASPHGMLPRTFATTFVTQILVDTDALVSLWFEVSQNPHVPDVDRQPCKVLFWNTKVDQYAARPRSRRRASGSNRISYRSTLDLDILETDFGLRAGVSGPSTSCGSTIEVRQRDKDTGWFSSQPEPRVAAGRRAHLNGAAPGDAWVSGW